jgi:SAM-dependent methyltransferase
LTSQPVYDHIGVGYTATRRADPYIAQRIMEALGDARSVVNVGAGAGAYEPGDREVIAIEPSATMIAQRPPDAAPVIQGVAEQLPLADRSVDAVMAILTLHHWSAYERGLAEMRRVARRRVVVLSWDPAYVERFWMRDYLAQLGRRDAARFVSLEEQARAAGAATVTVVPVPHDCRDGFGCAFWRRPEAYLDPAVRAGISTFHLCSEDDPELAAGLRRLADDLESGRWHQRHGHLLTLDQLDLGYRLITVEL